MTSDQNRFEQTHISAAEQVLAGLTKVKIAVVGDYMLDQYIYGDVNRISPEAPVPVVRYSHEKFIPGGAGNVTANLVGLGAAVYAMGRIGKDSCGDVLLNLPCMQKADSSAVLRNGGTIVKTRVLGGGRQQIVRIDRETLISPDAAQISSAIVKLREFIEAGLNAVIISDYGKGFCAPELCRQVIGLCGDRGIKVFVDPKCRDWSRYSGAFLVTPNLRELSQAAGEELPNEDGVVVEKGEKLLAQYAIDNLLVTRSDKGATLITQTGFTHCRADSVEVFDVSGAGDTMIATTAAFSAAGVPLEDCVTIANTASQVVIGKIGTCPITAEELAEALLAKESPQRLKTAGDYKTAAGLCQRWKDAGQKLVFTNGCFDILHAGHIDSLRRAAQLGGRLVVGLNSDASVRRLKGPERPVNSQDARAAVLAALECVDLVVVFDEDTPEKLLSMLRPDVIVKGGDYRPEQVIGREYAGEVVILPLVAGYSTTGIIKKIGAHE